MEKQKCAKCGSYNEAHETYNLMGQVIGWITYCWCGHKTKGGFFYKSKKS